MVDFPADYQPGTLLNLSLREVERDPSMLRVHAMAGDTVRLMEGDRQIAVIVPTPLPDREESIDDFPPRRPGQTWLDWMLQNPCPVEINLERDRGPARGTNVEPFS